MGIPYLMNILAVDRQAPHLWSTKAERTYVCVEDQDTALAPARQDARKPVTSTDSAWRPGWLSGGARCCPRLYLLTLDDGSEWGSSRAAT